MEQMLSIASQLSKSSRTVRSKQWHPLHFKLVFSWHFIGIVPVEIHVQQQILRMIIRHLPKTRCCKNQCCKCENVLHDNRLFSVLDAAD